MPLWVDILVLLAATVFFYRPFIAWPPDPHFGSNSMWALFRAPGAPLPEEVVLGNAGCSRIFLHYLVLAALRVFDRRGLHMTMRGIQATAFFLAATALCLTGRAYLGFPPPIALATGLLLVFTATRPQLEPTYLNAEPYYVLAQSLGMSCLFTGLAWDWPAPALGVYTFALVFAALHTKPPFLAEPLIVGGSFWLLTGLGLDTLAAFIAGGLAGAGTFVGLMRRHLYPGAKDLMCSYHSVFRGGLKVLWRNLESRWRTGLNRSTLGGLGLLAAAGMLLPPRDVHWLLIVAWMTVTILLLAGQFRFELYHFLIVLPAASLLAGRGLTIAWETHPAAALLLAGGALAMMRTALADLPFLHGKAAVEAKMARALPRIYPHYFDLRMEAMARHYKAVSAPDDRFLGWGIVPQIHYVTGVAPVSTYTFFHHWMEFLLPKWKGILLDDLRRSRPRWLYDFNTWHRDHGQFNPLAMYAASGLRYVPWDRFENIVCYRLADESPPNLPRDTAWPLYVRFSPIEDFLRHELGLGRQAQRLPNLAEAVAAELEGRLSLAAAAEMAVEAALSSPSPWGIMETYGAVIRLHHGDGQGAAALLGSPCPHLGSCLSLSPSLALAREALARRTAGQTRQVILEAEIINRLPATEARDVIRLVAAMARAGLLLEDELARVVSAMGGVRVDGGAWSNAAIEAEIMEQAALLAALPQ